MKYKINNDSVKNEAIRKSKSTKRTIVKSQGNIAKDAILGKVVEVSTKLYVVEYLTETKVKRQIDCFVAGSLVSPHPNGTLIASGDDVKFIIYTAYSDEETTAELAETGTIVEVCQRQTKLSRIDPANNNREHVVAANMDTLLIFMSVFDPVLNFRLIDRLLVAAMLGKCSPAICINKIDLAEMDEIDDLFDPYRQMNIPVFFISVENSIGLDALLSFLKNKDTVMVGMSGVGKSTLLNNILGRRVQKVLEVSFSSGKGRHTTSFVKRFELPKGGYLTDTPGVREFALWDLNPDELPLFFQDFNDYFHGCKYLTCTHTHEPACRVKEAVDGGGISSERYQSYLNILGTMEK